MTPSAVRTTTPSGEAQKMLLRGLVAAPHGREHIELMLFSCQSRCGGKHSPGLACAARGRQ